MRAVQGTTGVSWYASEVVSLLIFRLPGFAAAAVFYSLTSHPQPGAFVRVVQALIFTVFAQALTDVFLRLVSISNEHDSWTNNWELLSSVVLAVLIALLAAIFSNTDTAHRILRRSGITEETSCPSEWYSAFSWHHNQYVVLRLRGQRRLLEWPEEWPSRPHEGHFRIAEGEWLDDGGRFPLTGVSAILIPDSEVEMVEFLE